MSQSKKKATLEMNDKEEDGGLMILKSKINYMQNNYRTLCQNAHKRRTHSILNFDAIHASSYLLENMYFFVYVYINLHETTKTIHKRRKSLSKVALYYVKHILDIGLT